MKTNYRFTIVVLFLSLLTLSSSAKWIRVKFNPGDVFIYEWRSNKASRSDKSLTDGSRVVLYSLQIDSISREKIAFSARVLRQINEKGNFAFENSKDYGFPQLTKYYQEGQLSDVLEETLYRIPFRFELDRKVNTISLVNQEEIISRSEDILKSRHYANKIIEEITVSLKYNVLYNKTKFFLQPFHYIRTNLDYPDTLTDNKTKILVQNLNNGMLEVNGVPNKTISQLNYKIDLQHGLIVSSVKRTRLEERNLKIYGAPFVKQTEPEETLKLIERTSKCPKKIIVCGHIENPVSKQVNLYTQTKIFGTELDSKSVQLDNSGNFRFEFKLVEKGLIFLLNKNNNHYYNSVPILLYSKPGDSIYVNISLINKEYQVPSYDPNTPNSKITEKYTVPQSIAFSGDRSKEGRLLYQFQNAIELPQIWKNKILRVDCNVYLKALSELKALLKPLAEDESCSESAQYLQKELQASLYSGLFNARLDDQVSSVYRMFDGSIIPANMKDKVFSQLDTFNIQRIYNDYGIFSRALTESYVNYKTYRLANTNSRMALSFRTFRLGWSRDPEQNLQFCKMILFGSPMYREAASQLYSYMVSAIPDSKTDSQWQAEINEMFDLMIERCNDETFSRSLREIVENFNKWKGTKHVPDNQFLNLNGEKVSLRSFIKKRATIIYASRNWSTGRYEMDEAAKNHSEINFVHIDEGENFEYWKKWNSRANPIANQLYFSSDSSGLGDIFLNNIAKFIIFDKSGKRIGITREIEDAIQIAENGRRQYFKDVSKSVLSGIILFLGGLLLVSLAGFLIYKIRMNQKLRKHRQEKRLRELQLAALRAQMNPHFLFNSLNSVQNLVQQNKSKEAHLYLSDFAGLIRKVLKNSDKEEVTLAEEIDTLRKYLNLEKLRFDFDYQIDIEEHIDQNLFMLPSLILQPLAENALTHGLQHKEGEKKLLISVTKSNNEIHIIIEDNGIGIDAAQKFKTNSNGIGLRMNEERIQMMKDKYGGNYSFKLINRAAEGKEGTRVEITIPEEQ
jgi:signal transduction histidine kinase